MPKILNVRELDVWQRAIELTDLVYEITAKFPDADRRHYISPADMKRFEKLATSTGQLAHGLLRSLEPREV